MVLWALVGSGVVVALSGLALSFLYRPPDLDPSTGFDFNRDGGEILGVLEDLHRFSGFVFAALVVVVALLTVIRSDVDRRAIRVGGTAVAAVGAFFAFVSGGSLPWDQIALRAVSVGDLAGIWSPLFDADVAFVIIDSVEIPISEYATRVVLHLVVWPAVLVLGFIVATRGRPPDPS